MDQARISARLLLIYLRNWGNLLSMILYTKCPNCSEQCTVKGSYSDRGEMAKKIGDTIDLTCEKCGRKSKVYVADVKAKTSNTFMIGSLIICLALIIFFSTYGSNILLASMNNYYTVTSWLLILSPAVVYVYLIDGHRKSVHQFNRYRN